MQPSFSGCDRNLVHGHIQERWTAGSTRCSTLCVCCVESVPVKVTVQVPGAAEEDAVTEADAVPLGSPEMATDETVTPAGAPVAAT